MSLSSQLNERSAGRKCPTHNSSTRPRLYGFISTPEAIDFTALASQAHAANQTDRGTPKGSRSGFGNTSRLAGFDQNPRARRKVRKALRLAGWIRRAKLTTDANARTIVGEEPKIEQAPQSVAGKVAAKVSRFFGRVFGRKGGR